MDGLDYNTQRPHLVMPEYGRIVQDMVQYAVTLESKDERQAAAQKIIETMATMAHTDKGSPDFKHKLWNHLALISDFKLDIDYPYDVEEAKVFTEHPEPMAYPEHRIPVKHYGKMIHDCCEILATMPEGPERDELVKNVANQMRRDLLEYGHSNAKDETVFHDLARFTDGCIQLDAQNFKFDKSVIQTEKQETKKKKKKKKKK